MKTTKFNKSDSVNAAHERDLKLDKDFYRGLLLPNVDSFMIGETTLDEYAKAFGLSRAIDRQILTKSLGRNKGNEFLKRVWKKLYIYAQKGEGKKFWTLSQIMLTRSIALRTLALFNVERRWYKDETLHKVKQAWSEVN